MGRKIKDPNSISSDVIGSLQRSLDIAKSNSYFYDDIGDLNALDVYENTPLYIVGKDKINKDVLAETYYSDELNPYGYINYNKKNTKEAEEF